MKQYLLLTVLTFIFNYCSAQLPQTALATCPLKVSQKVPEVELTDINSNLVRILDTLKQKPTVLIFYRGGWCPYCNRHLAALQSIEKKIIKMGYQIIAISPDAPHQLSKTVSSNSIRYSLFSDSYGKLAKAMGVAFRASAGKKKKLLDYSNGNNTGFLPIPSVFIIDTEGTIMYEYINPDYKTRLDNKTLLVQLSFLYKQQKK